MSFFAGTALRADDFESAAQLYDQGKFSEAKGIYEGLVERGEWSANLFYNLGNTDYRLGAPGRAMLNYERALALDSTHAEARANLHWVREQSGAKVPAKRWWEHALPVVAADVYLGVGVAAFWIAVFCASARLFGRRAWGWATVALLLAAYSAAGFWWRQQDRALAVITASQAVARLAPADRASVAESLPAGSQVRVLSERGEWVYCALPGGGLGWVAASQLEQVRSVKS